MDLPLANPSASAPSSNPAESANRTMQQFLKDRNKALGNDSRNDPNFLVSEYEKADGETRRHLFRELSAKFLPLIDIPAADRRLAHLDRLQDPIHGDGYNSSDEEDDAVSLVDAYQVRDGFRERWTRNEGPSLDSLTLQSPTDDDGVSWGTFDLLTVPGIPGFVAKPNFQTPDGVWIEGTRSVRVWHLISSQLMLYRLIAVLGMPRGGGAENLDDRYKSIWSYTLYWRGGHGEKSELRIYDYKGSMSFHFLGQQEASESALDLLEWLVGDEVPHTYDGVVAGNQA
ncbi:hypothetical protein QBC37DRAFT_428563 [Rhypophila decipiens]|uniref:Uncharacterized protein n=1 Tax=Rhypophila decipiens TaxID=261697 RepID=A0AAN7B4H3_9PEZI|nr:hypothetical protein QBC37DRAFT_428563 [Rhypophila decipiens]